MPGPARAGLFIYAKNLERVAQFYEAVAQMKRFHARDEIIVLQAQDIQLVVHKVPSAIAESIEISSPPIKRENTALKFFFTVASLNEARQIASKCGGEIYNENWQGPGFVACNAIDPEGNVFQARESA